MIRYIPVKPRPRPRKGVFVLPTVEADRFAIRELVENWALWRDAGDWERFATVWHPTEGWMTATWFQGPAPEFIAASRQGFDAGVSILHFLGGHAADVAGDRAIAQTKMTISQRAGIDGVTGRRRVHGPLLRLRAAAGADAVAGLPPSPGGAGQAIEDAAALAVCLATGPWDPPAALARYERVRLPRAS